MMSLEYGTVILRANPGMLQNCVYAYCASGRSYTLIRIYSLDHC